ncbi:AAA family ATPase, partial [Streptomyces zhihengii]
MVTPTGHRRTAPPRPPVRRIQFTPDLLPSDITGVSIFDQQRREF